MKNSSFCPIAICLATVWAFVFAPSAILAQQGNDPDSIVQITTRLPGHTKPSTVTVSVKNGIATMQGDIILGPIEKLLHPPVQDRGLVMEDLDDRWPGGIIPFEINGLFSPAFRESILSAIDYINGSTNLLMLPKGADSDYWINFVPTLQGYGSSQVGLQDEGGQAILLPEGFAFIGIIHEIAHAAGLRHEQCRSDRDQYVDIHWVNIEPEALHNFVQDNDESIDIGGYDFNSIMHYSSRAFALDNTKPTITRKNGSESMGNFTDFSNGDVAAINWLYPDKFCWVSFSLTHPIPIVMQRLHYEAISFINSNTTIASTNDLTFDAGQEITLQPGFEVQAGATFLAVVDGCGGQVQPFNSSEADEWYAQAGTYEDRLARNLSAGMSSGNVSNGGSLLNIAPNPFSGSSTVTYSLQSEQKVAMSLMDATGKLVATPLPAQTQSEGVYQFNLEAGSLPAGMYFLVLQLGEKRETKRLILTK